MVEGEQIDASKAVQRRTGRTFHFATRLLPERARHATYALYAFFRIADEVVDDPDGPAPAAAREELERIRAAALGERETDDPVLSAFQEMRERHGIADEEINAFIDSMAMDVDRARYDSHEELSEYLRGSSVAVAYMMLDVMDPEDREAARPHAKALGEAFQLTNFLRDVREDIRDYDRIYLPLETLRRHGVDEEQIEAGEYSPAFAAAMREELRRTEKLYHEGVAGIRYLPEGCQFAVLLAAVLYADHHRLIRRLNCDVLSTRPTLGGARRIWLLVRTWLAWRRTADPAEAFYRASAISRPETEEFRDAGDEGTGRAIARTLRAAIPFVHE